MIEDLNLMVSLYCPGKCVNCNIWRQSKYEITKDEISLELIEKILNSKKLKNLKYIDLTAGESQLSPKYLEIIKLISKYFPNVFIHTNISGWYPEIHLKVTENAIKYIDPKKFRIDISLDGRKENYFKIRLMKNGWEKAISTAKLLKPLGIILRFVMIIYKENYKDIEWFWDFCQKMGIDFYFGYARNSNLLNNKDKDFSFSDKEIEIIEEKLKKVGWLTKRRLPNWLWAKSIYKKKIPFFKCYMGKLAIVIDPYGNVYPCNERIDFLKMGNLKEYNGDLDKLLDSKNAKKVIKLIESKKCQPCSSLCAHKIEFPWGKQTGMQ